LCVRVLFFLPTRIYCCLCYCAVLFVQWDDTLHWIWRWYNETHWKLLNNRGKEDTERESTGGNLVKVQYIYASTVKPLWTMSMHLKHNGRECKRAC
jgi:hypothetical protein